MVLGVGIPELPPPSAVLKTSPEVPPGKVVREVTETTHIKVQHNHTMGVSSFVLTSEVRRYKLEETSSWQQMIMVSFVAVWAIVTRGIVLIDCTDPVKQVLIISVFLLGCKGEGHRISLKFGTSVDFGEARPRCGRRRFSEASKRGKRDFRGWCLEKVSLRHQAGHQKLPLTPPAACLAKKSSCVCAKIST